MDHLQLTCDKLSADYIVDLVSSSSCGAISLFVGTTRNNFEGKTVLNLEYEAYRSMALKVLQDICNDIRNKWPAIENIAIYHRLGVVPVKEASIVIAVSSPHRPDAIKATEYCIDNVKKSVPIWKKEIYAEDPPQWKENVESSSYPPKLCPFKLDFKQEVKVPPTPPNLIQIKAGYDEINKRIEKLMERKREEINESNIRDFCIRNPNTEIENSCARVDAVLIRRKDSKGHLKVDRVLNTYSRDQDDIGYLTKYMPKNGIEERIHNIETQLNLETPVSKDIYQRLKQIEDRILYLESVSPEYVQFWGKSGSLVKKQSRKKRIFTIEEIDNLIADLENKRNNEKVMDTT